MKIIFMGTPDFAAASLKRLIDEKYDIAAVFTQPDKPVGRHQVLTPPPVKQLALENSIQVYQPKTLRDGEAFKIISNINPDIIIVVAYGKMLPVDILNMPMLGCVNVHASLLPKYRGAGPIQWSVINGEKTTGVTTMFMAEGCDTGDMILKTETPISPDETWGELHDRLAVIGADALIKTLNLFKNNGANVPRQKQDDSQASSAPMLDKKIAEIDFAKPALQVHNLVRGLSPWPVAYTKLDGKLLKIYKTAVANGKGKAGEIIDEKSFVVACGEGAVQFLEVQFEGGKKMSATEFLRGKKFEKGTILPKLN